VLELFRSSTKIAQLFSVSVEQCGAWSWVLGAEPVVPVLGLVLVVVLLLCKWIFSCCVEFSFFFVVWPCKARLSDLARMTLG